MKKILVILTIYFVISSFIGVTGGKGFAVAEEMENPYGESEEKTSEQTEEETSIPEGKTDMGEKVEGEWGGESAQESESDYGSDW